MTSNDSSVEALEQWLKEELDDHAHGTMTTCDRQGDMLRSRREGQKETLKEVAERIGYDYEHDPETCEECQEMREYIESDESNLDMTDEEIEESEEVHGV